MRKYIVAAALVALGASGSSMEALAADLAVRKAPPPVYTPVAPAWSWTGFYIGGHAGYGGDRFDYPFEVTPGPLVAGRFNITSGGFFGGGQAGFNWQFGQFVLGVETDIATSDIRGRLAFDLTAPVGFNITGQSHLNYFGTVRGRLGLAWDKALFYVTGGWAYGEVTSSGNIGAAAVSTTYNKDGYAVGAGIEYALSNWISVKSEYMYLDLGRDNLLTAPLGGGLAFRIDEKTTVHSFKTGVNFKLWSPGGGPVMASY